ncbi:MAG: hypothetical protein AB8B91_22545, partial [Rubripirellula sp.]
GKEICLCGTTPDGMRECVVVSTRGSEDGFEVLVRSTQSAPALAWHPRGKEIMLAIKNAAGHDELWLIDRNAPPNAGDYPDNPLATPTDRDWSADGKVLIFSSQIPAKFDPE